MQERFHPQSIKKRNKIFVKGYSVVTCLKYTEI